MRPWRAASGRRAADPPGRSTVPRLCVHAAGGALSLSPSPSATAAPARPTWPWGWASPLASAEATSVIILSPALARPGALPKSRCFWRSSGRPRCRARVAGRTSPALATRRRSSKVIWIRSGWLRGSICWVLLVLGSVCCYKTIIPEAQEHFPVSSGPRYTPSFGGLGLSLGVRECPSAPWKLRSGMPGR